MLRNHPLRLLADEEGNGSDAGRDDATSNAVLLLARGGVRRKSPPSHRPGQTELVEKVGIIISDSPPENLPLPTIGLRFKALELLKHLECAALAENLRAGRDVLPSQQPVHELRGGEGLNSAPQRFDRKPMNAGEQAPLTPLGLLPERISKVAAQHRAAAFETQNDSFKFGRFNSEKAAQPRTGYWAEVGHPALDIGQGGVFARWPWHVYFWKRRFEARIRKKRQESCGLLRGHPIGSMLNGGTPGAMSGLQFGKIMFPARNGLAPSRRNRARRSLPGILERRSRRQARLWQSQQSQQRIVKFIGIAHIRVRLLAHFGDRCRIKPANFREHRLGEHTAHFDGPRATFLKGSIVEVGIGIGIQNFV